MLPIYGAPHLCGTCSDCIMTHTTYSTLVMGGLWLVEKKNKKGHPLGVEQTHGRFYRDFPHVQILCTWSFRECRRHYSSWEVSRESQSSPLRFFVESIATDHQEVSSFFSEKKTVLLRFRTRDLEPRVVSPDQPATVTLSILLLVSALFIVTRTVKFDKK